MVAVLGDKTLMKKYYDQICIKVDPDVNPRVESIDS